MSNSLIILAKAGDEHSTKKLLEQALRLIPKMAFKYNNMAFAEIEDAFQDAIAIFLKDPASVKATTDGQFFAWFLTVVDNLLKDRLKSHDYDKKRPLINKDEDGEEYTIDIVGPENVEGAVFYNELETALEAGMKELPDIDQRILNAHQAGVSLREVADLTGLTYENVRQRKSRAVRRLKKFLGDFFKTA